MGWLIELAPHGEDAVALFPDELLESVGWKAGDELDWCVEEKRLILTRRPAPPPGEGSSEHS